MKCLIPPLKPDPGNKIGNPDLSGKWDNREFAELAKLSESLNIELNPPAWLELSGIPDIWARPLLFEIALLDENHLLHDRTVNEWRGLLALLALRNVYNFRVTTSDELTVDSRNRFLKALNDLKPERRLHPSTGWGKIFIIYFNGQPIGITSPTTLVCTSATQVNLGNIPWVKELRLSSPVDVLNNQKRGQLNSWLERLENDIRRLMGPDDVINANGLLKLVQDFRTDLGAPNVSISDGHGIFSMTGLYRFLNVPIDAGDGSDSHLAIISNNSRVLDQIIVAEPDIARQWGVDSHEVVIFNNFTLDQIPLSGITDEKRIGPFTLRNHRIWNARKLFADKLHLFEQKNALPLVYNCKGGDSLDIDGEMCTPILPLAKELLDYYQPEELSERVTYHMDGDGITVSLRLTLSGSDGSARDYMATCKYTRCRDEIVHISHVPLLSIWPNFMNPSWNLFYSIYWNETDSLLSIKPFVPYDITEDRCRAIRGGYVVQLSSFPEIYFCSFRNLYAGLLLVRKPGEVLYAGHKEWKIGVDFGTTGTNVYYMSNETGKSPLFPTLRCRSMMVTSSGETVQLNNIFFPNGDQFETFLSIFRDVSGIGQDPYYPLLDGHILYLPDASKSLRNYEEKREAGNLRYDLKWGREAEVGSHKLVKSFLKQLCIQTMAEAASQGVESVSWSFSYPSSFSYDLKNNFIEASRNTADECHCESGLACGKIMHEPESVAAAKYFHSSLGGTFAAGAICIDIGGGTSDISIWRQELVWQSSIRFAGGDIFTDVLQKHKDLRDRLGFTSIVSDKYLRIASESSIRVDGDTALKKLTDVFMTPEVKKLQQIITLSLAAIFHYIGLAVKDLITRGKYEISECPNIYIAGGGSKLFHWAAGGPYHDDHKISGLFKHIFISAAGLNAFPSSSKIIISPRPKAEAAIGLVSDSPLCPDNESLAPNYLAGEAVIVNGRRIEWHESIDARIIAGATIKRATPTSFVNFVHIFNAKCLDYAISPVGIDRLLTEVGMKVDEVFSRYNRQNETEIQLEPIFITYIKTLIQLLNE